MTFRLSSGELHDGGVVPAAPAPNLEHQADLPLPYLAWEGVPEVTYGTSRPAKLG